MADLILVTGAAGRVGAVGRTITELLLKNDVLTLTGHTPLSVQEFVRRNAAAFTASTKGAASLSADAVAPAINRAF